MLLCYIFMFSQVCTRLWFPWYGLHYTITFHHHRHHHAFGFGLVCLCPSYCYPPFLFLFLIQQQFFLFKIMLCFRGSNVWLSYVSNYNNMCIRVELHGDPYFRYAILKIASHTYHIWWESVWLQIHFLKI